MAYTLKRLSGLWWALVCWTIGPIEMPLMVHKRECKGGIKYDATFVEVTGVLQY